MSTIAAVLAGEARWCVIEGNSMALLQGVPAAAIDAIITDCPYSSGGATRGDRVQGTKTKYVNSDSATGQELPEFDGDSRDQRSFLFWCTLWYAECLRVAKPGAVLLTFTDWRQLPVTTDAVQAGGWIWRGIVPWNKGEGTRPRKGLFRAQCEYLVFATAGPFSPWGDDAPCFPGFYSCSSARDRLHIAQKPERLMRDVALAAPPDGVVLDPYCGSGTTVLGAMLEGRRAIGFEINPATAALARERMAAEEQGMSLSAVRAGQVAMFGAAK